MKYKKWVCFAGLFVIAVIAGKSIPVGCRCEKNIFSEFHC